MSFFQRFVWIFMSPYRVFDEIRESKVGWVQPWLMGSILVVVGTWLMMPIQSILLENNPQMADANIEGQMKIMQTIQVFIAPVMVLLVAVIVTGITYVVVTLMSKEATFKKYFTLVLFADIVASVGFLATVLILRARGLDQISSPEDMKVGLSLRLLAPEAGPVLGGLLGSIEFFAIWAFTLIVLGLRRLFGFGLGAALACSIPLWLFYAAFAVMGELFNVSR